MQEEARAREQEAAHGGGRFKTSGADIRSKVAAISANSGKHPVSAMCGVLGVPRSTYYWAISHPEPERADDPIAGDVVRIYEDNRRKYGAPKIKRALAREGIVASRRRIKRIMNQKACSAPTPARSANPVPPRRARRRRPTSSTASSTATRPIPTS